MTTTNPVNIVDADYTDSNVQDVIELRDVYISFGDNDVLKGLNLNIADGESVIVVGKSGSGKSILIKCIVGLVTPDSGEIKVFGKDVLSMDRKEISVLRTQIGFLFQNNALYDSLTVRENLEFPLRRYKKDLTDEQVETKIQEALADVGLENTADLMPPELSGGMQKRIALARTLIVSPKIMLYDEPTTGLDPITARGIIELMANVQKKYKTTSIIITHDMNCVKYFGKHIAMLIDGICYTEGNYDELAASPDPKIHNFFE